ncbi:MAG: nucleotidyltransferase family protein [Desulfosarcina sp.]|nr:nucleotidyltransferase family protein [Desulfobacterales bacterium]
MNRDSILKTLSNHKQLLRRHGVKAIRLFGSFARGEAAAGSDVDLLVEFEPTAHVGLFEFSRLRHELSNLLGCEVDLATPDALHKAMRDEILNEAIYAA